MEKLWLSEAMLKKAENGEKLEYGALNLINAPAGSGKTTFIYKELLDNSGKYIDGLKYNFSYNLDKCMMVCDTSTLVDSNLLDEENKGRVKILSEGELSKAMKNYSFDKLIENECKCGKMLVITYSLLGDLLKQDNCKKIITEDFNLIVFDEIHNLPIYADKFDNDKQGYKYGTVIQNIKEIIDNKTLMIGLTATLVNTEYKLDKYSVKCKTLFEEEELKNIRSYTEGKKNYINYAPNIIKEYISRKDEVFRSGEKLLIYTNFNKTSKKYKELFAKYGIKAEWLCSKRAKNGNDLVMNNHQIKLRTQLLEGSREINRGILPDDLDVLIVNAAYETGWNLYDDRIQHVIVDDVKDYTWVQARNRVRHDIKELYVKCVYSEDSWYDGVYNRIGKGQYAENIILDNEIYIPKLIKDKDKRILDRKYLNKELSKQDKKEIVELYGVKYPGMNREPSIKKVLDDIDRLGHIVHKTKHYGTWIFDIRDIKDYMKNNNIKKYYEELDEEYRKYISKEGKNMSGKEELYNYLELLETIPLNKEQQEELINKVNVRVDGKQQRTAKKITAELTLRELPFEIESKRLTINKIKDTYWLVNKI
ncbi:DEAD/DEAH box helicase family protein [Paeniclostridium sordellii]|nr:DEAD/DEAH box helicase family protein [Paeniclostridium sordellii]